MREGDFVGKDDEVERTGLGGERGPEAPQGPEGPELSAHRRAGLSLAGGFWRVV